MLEAPRSPSNLLSSKDRSSAYHSQVFIGRSHSHASLFPNYFSVKEHVALPTSVLPKLDTLPSSQFPALGYKSGCSPPGRWARARGQDSHYRSMCRLWFSRWFGSVFQPPLSSDSRGFEFIWFSFCRDYSSWRWERVVICLLTQGRDQCKFKGFHLWTFHHCLSFSTIVYSSFCGTMCLPSLSIWSSA